MFALSVANCSGPDDPEIQDVQNSASTSGCDGLTVATDLFDPRLLDNAISVLRDEKFTAKQKIKISGLNGLNEDRIFAFQTDLGAIVWKQTPRQMGLEEVALRSEAIYQLSLLIGLETVAPAKAAPSAYRQQNGLVTAYIPNDRKELLKLRNDPSQFPAKLRDLAIMDWIMYRPDRLKRSPLDQDGFLLNTRAFGEHLFAIDNESIDPFEVGYFSIELDTEPLSLHRAVSRKGSIPHHLKARLHNALDALDEWGKRYASAFVRVEKENRGNEAELLCIIRTKIQTLLTQDFSSKPFTYPYQLNQDIVKRCRGAK